MCLWCRNYSRLTCHLQQPVLAVVWPYDGLRDGARLKQILGPLVLAEALAVSEVIRTAVGVDSPAS